MENIDLNALRQKLNDAKVAPCDCYVSGVSSATRYVDMYYVKCEYRPKDEYPYAGEIQRYIHSGDLELEIPFSRFKEFGLK